VSTNKAACRLGFRHTGHVSTNKDRARVVHQFLMEPCPLPQQRRDWVQVQGNVSVLVNIITISSWFTHLPETAERLELDVRACHFGDERNNHAVSLGLNSEGGVDWPRLQVRGSLGGGG
jgi:hypothetical protein